MKRKPHNPVHPVRQTVIHALAILLLSGAPVTLRAQKKEPSKAEPVRKVAAVDPKILQSPSAPDPSMILKSVSGQEIEARLVSAKGDMVKIARVGDGREFDVPISTFDEYTGERIRSWIQNDPNAVEFSLTISATKSLIDTCTFMSAGRDFKTAEWSYRVTVANLTRNTLSGAKLEYRVVYDDEVEFVRTSVEPGQGANRQDGQLVDLPEMNYNDEIEFDSPAIKLHTFEFVPARGEREYSRDTLKGIWIRIVKEGKVLAEYWSNPATMENLSWDNEEDEEIRVRDSFRDQFATKVKD